MIDMHQVMLGKAPSNLVQIRVNWIKSKTGTGKAKAMKIHFK